MCISRTRPALEQPENTNAKPTRIYLKMVTRNHKKTIQKQPKTTEISIEINPERTPKRQHQKREHQQGGNLRLGRPGTSQVDLISRQQHSRLTPVLLDPGRSWLTRARSKTLAG